MENLRKIKIDRDSLYQTSLFYVVSFSPGASFAQQEVIVLFPSLSALNSVS